MRLALAFALLGFGVPTAAAGALLFRLAFLPGRGSSHALYVFSPDHPLAKTAGVLVVVAAALLIPAYLLFMAAPRLPPKPPGWTPPGPANFSE